MREGGSLDLKIISMAPLFTIIFVSKLVSVEMVFRTGYKHCVRA
jgi:hypothetical protein